jgi:hypothetical protein
MVLCSVAGPIRRATEAREMTRRKKASPSARFSVRELPPDAKRGALYRDLMDTMYRRVIARGHSIRQWWIECDCPSSNSTAAKTESRRVTWDNLMRLASHPVAALSDQERYELGFAWLFARLGSNNQPTLAAWTLIEDWAEEYAGALVDSGLKGGPIWAAWKTVSAWVAEVSAERKSAEEQLAELERQAEELRRKLKD